MSDPAAARYLWITLSRLAGLLAVIAGLVISTRSAPGANVWLGLVLSVGGLAWSVLVPRALIRRWRS
jgi:hypothetical protein